MMCTLQMGLLIKQQPNGLNGNRPHHGWDIGVVYSGSTGWNSPVVPVVWANSWRT